jgi:hypothetical protein
MDSNRFDGANFIYVPLAFPSNSIIVRHTATHESEMR